MAVGAPSASGFSYAQAARGTTAPTSQAASSKVTSGAATPATSVSMEATSGGNWADDVEESEGSKPLESQKADEEESKPPAPKDSAIDRMKMEESVSNGVSGIASPETTGSSTTSATTRDDSPSAQTGSTSDITSDTKSQASEPSWIAEREKRQNGSPSSESTAKPERGERKSKKNATATPPKEEPKVVVLQEAAPPPVNPWQKRAEEAKAKVVTTPKPAPAPTTTNAAPVQKENTQPPTTSRKQSAAGTPQREPPSSESESQARPSAPSGKRSSEARISNRQGSKPSTGESDKEPGSARPARPGPAQSRSLPNLTNSLPPPVKDETSWPTPETAQEKERKVSPEKESDEKRDDDSTPAAKRKKDVWKVVPVVPSVIWETQSMNEPRERKPRPAGSERGGRGGARGRGAHRGGATTVTTGDRQSMTTPPSGAAPEQTPRDGAPAAENASTSAKQTHVPSTHKASDPTIPTSDEATPVTSAKDASTQVDATSRNAETRGARSPKRSSRVAENGEVPTPAPIPRKPAHASDGSDEKARNDPPVRMVPTENRKEYRNNDVFRDPSWTGTPRGGKRGGRGRGGNAAPPRDAGNGHAYGAAYGEVNGPAAYGAPSSPSTYSRGNHHQFGYPPPGPGRGSWRGGPRSHSIPIESYYPRFVSQPFTGGPGQMQNVHTYMPGASDFNGSMQPPMSAVMPSPMDAQASLLVMVTVQLEYYFGVDNMIRDMYLRKHMDSQGFVFLEFIAGFNRLKQLTTDTDLLKTACLNSEIIEIRLGEDGKERLRKREGWEQFVRPMEERDVSAQTDGPQRLERPERPQLSMPIGPSHFQGPYSAGLPAMHQRTNHRSYDSGMPMMSGFAPQFVPNGDYHRSMYGGSMGNGEEMRGRSTKSPVYENGVGPTDGSFASTEDDAHAEPDAFPDEQVGALGIVVRNIEQRAPYHSAATRTFSNGSIDSRSIATELDKASETDAKQLPNGGPHTNGGDNLPSFSRHLSPNKARSLEQGPANQEREVTWAKDVSNIPDGTTYEPYTQLRLKALDQRQHASTGNCPYDLDVLYQFWCHFLCRNFNNNMYKEFHYYAQKDARERHSLAGINNLLKFYAHSLNSFDSIRERVAKDYVELVKNEPPALEGAAFKQLRSAWRNGALNLKNRKKLADIMDEQLKSALDNKPEA